MDGDGSAEAASLNYWALRLGGLSALQSDDAFMDYRGLPGWDALTLLRALVRSLVEIPKSVDLCAPSLWHADRPT
ncbi:hypothetical protein [Streptomyces sp. WAC 06783]|uniref:hypothetical protein n=1 Tax=Streptomyces sp. WAC 06783 TaxID=2203211 RepID=UPI00163D1F79|nr:hypothetical protein [Streptomyces sp. WAC 06783]